MKEILLTTPSKAYKPHNFPWAYNFWQIQQQIHWVPEEIPMGEDVKDWGGLPENERHFLTQIFRFFTQADIDVNGGYLDLYLQLFKPVELRMMLSAFNNIETVHIAAYALLIETIGMPDIEFSKFLEFKEMTAKHDFLTNFTINSERDVLRTIATYSGFTEGMQLFASFAMLLSFPRLGRMKGMGQVITWSVRDESLHCEGMMKLFHEYAQATGMYDIALKKEIREIAEQMVLLEDRFIELAFEQGPPRGLEINEIKNYIRYITDWRLEQLGGLKPIYNIKEYPIPWLRSLLNGVEHANFFEARATEYSKGVTNGSWEQVWGTYDSRYNDLFAPSMELE